MNTKTRANILSLLLLAATACRGSEGDPQQESSDDGASSGDSNASEQQDSSGDHDPSTGSDGETDTNSSGSDTESDTGSDGDDDSDIPKRILRRMDLDQLQGALESVFPGQRWVRDGGDRLRTLAPTLGYPDYVEITQEDLTYSLLFAKFLEDAARALCDERLKLDQELPLAQREFLRDVEVDEKDPEKLKKLVRRLILRYLGIVATDQEVARWEQLYTATSSASGSLQAWHTVCVALVVDPRFATY